MDLIHSAPGSADPVAELRLLRRQLRRERARRQAAETLGERASADLYESVRELRSAQSDLLDTPISRVVNEALQRPHQDLNTGHLVNRAAEAVGRAIAVDRCDVVPVDARRDPVGGMDLVRVRSGGPVPRARSFVDLPEPPTTLLI